MEEFFSVAWQAAQSAGSLIRQNWQQAKEISYKSPIDLVTTIDRQAERRIVDILAQRFPDHSILAEEETAVVRSRSDYRWIVDPLDGTTNFVHSYPQFGVAIALERAGEIILGLVYDPSIALERAGEIILGLVYDPLREECFRAARGEGAFLNENRIRTSRVEELDKALLATGFPYDRRDRAAFYLAFFKAFLVRSQGIRRNGAASLDLCYLACGRIDGFWELKLRPWDTAAASLIVREAGGTVSDFSGKEFSIRGDETLASNGLIHGEMLRLVGEVAAKRRRSDR